MINDVFELTFELLLELVPNAVWKILLSAFGISMTGLGAAKITESTRIGAALLVVGTFPFRNNYSRSRLYHSTYLCFRASNGYDEIMDESLEQPA